MKYITHYKLFKESLSFKQVDFSEFPKDVLKTLEDEYFHYYRNNFDWNSKQQEFMNDGEYDGKGFREWMENNEKEEFVKNLNKIITATRQDLITIKKKKIAEKALENFEDLIIPTLGKEVMNEPLSKYMEIALMSNDIEDIQKAYLDAKNIIEQDGSVNKLKTLPSDLFTGEGINLPAFERFVEKNPEYQGVFDDWKKLFDESMEPKSLNAFRDSTPYNKIKYLYDFLVQYRKRINK
jgi:hypothetical protein